MVILINRVSKLLFMEVKMMAKFLLENMILDRLPIALSGISFTDFNFTGEVYPKLNISLKRNELSLP
ncbi:MAG: hypothetical protein ACJAX4_001819 [Clostridium sp.]|jgi:hypothetical protein